VLLARMSPSLKVCSPSFCPRLASMTVRRWSKTFFGEELAMIRGSCLCGGVIFEIEQAVGPFELCHCTRCRKVSGSAYLTWLGVRREHFRLLQGLDLINTYERPVSESPPPYDTASAAAAVHRYQTRQEPESPGLRYPRALSMMIPASGRTSTSTSNLKPLGTALRMPCRR
jgi:hypothetical protein